MLIKPDNEVLRRDYLLFATNQKPTKIVNSYEDIQDEEGELEIDLDYNEYTDISDEPLDLSMKKHSKTCDDIPLDLQKPKLPKLELKPNFKLFNLENKKEVEVEPPQENKGTLITEAEVVRLLEPYVKIVHKKYLCTVCDMKFANKVKALTHVENKHVDCLLYKCPLCRASKVTRLAYESHLRRGHNARVDQHSPLIKCKKKFCVKSEAQSSLPEAKTGHGNGQYDLQFVTFLRHTLSQSGHEQGTGADWVDQDQAIFKIANRELFTKRWLAFKGLSSGTWTDVYESVIAEFINRNIFKQLSHDLVFQVFCIKQLLK